jgi:hypothetical protein
VNHYHMVLRNGQLKLGFGISLTFILRYLVFVAVEAS